VHPGKFLLGVAAIAGLDACTLASHNVALAGAAWIAIGAIFALGHRSLERRESVARASPARRAWTAPSADVAFGRRDLAAAALLGASSFALSIAYYWVPNQKIFDEVYFARAAEEYLRNQRIFENTHPPLTKLIVTASVLAFGGLSRGDDAYGWRFLDVLFSALAVAVLYAFAKRVTGSRRWAGAAAAFFLFDGMHFVQSRIATPEGIVIFFSLAAAYWLYRFWTTPQWGRDAGARLAAFAIAFGCLIACKWYGAVLFVLALGMGAWQRPRGLRFAGFVVAFAGMAALVYALAWIPDLVRQSPDPNEIHTLRDVVQRQYDMFEYHYNLHATHPYASKWWEWPLDDVPVVYYYTPAPSPTPASCCVREITSMPNPLTLWFGLIGVPVVAWLAWRERNRGYAFVVLTYLVQWLPWAASPRIAWEYHYYVDVPLVCLCNAVVLQRLWQWSKARVPARAMAQTAVAAYAAAVAIAFLYFYPILAAVPITWGAWSQRMWFPTWIIGPG